MQQLTSQVAVHTSTLWQTNTGIIHGPQGAILVDPGIFPAELELIAAAAESVAAGFCTHAHWDHMLWHASLGEEVPRFATAETIALIHKDRNRIVSELASVEASSGESAESVEVLLWDRGQLFREQPIAWGRGKIAGIAVETVHIPGHQHGQTALLLPDHGVLFAADTLSDIETPSFENGSASIALYVQSLDRLQDLIRNLDWIVPGHGSPADRAEAQRRLDADRRYLLALKPAVTSAAKGEGADGIARRVLQQLGDQRAGSGLAWEMHLSNIQQLVNERDQLEVDLPVRRSSRLILLDSTYRVWMLRINDPIRPRWILPGGGVEEGENWEDAALRELWEECAIDDAQLGPMVATRDQVDVFRQFRTPEGKIVSGSTRVRVKERYFLVRINAQEPVGANMTEHEAGHYSKQAWFSSADIRASNEVVYPLGLADLLDTLARGELPDPP